MRGPDPGRAAASHPNPADVVFPTMKYLLSLLALAALVCAAPTLTLAASKKTPAATPAGATPAPTATPDPKNARPFPYHGDVDTVDASAKTFTFKSKEGNVRTFHVGDTAKVTKVSKDGPTADFSIVTVAAYAAGTCTKTGDRQYEIVTLHVGPKPAKKEKAAPATPAPKATPAAKAS